MFDSLTNKVLIAQITTNGKLTFKLNIQIGTPSGGYQQFVADSATGAEIKLDCLTFNSDSINHPNAIKDLESNNSISIYPNPTSGIFTLKINAQKQNSDNYYAIYNILGNVLLMKKINTALDNYIENIDVSLLPHGIYFIEVTINGVRSGHKLIKD